VEGTSLFAQPVERVVSRSDRSPVNFYPCLIPIGSDMVVHEIPLVPHGAGNFIVEKGRETIWLTTLRDLDDETS
jgi:hypothetical protein